MAETVLSETKSSAEEAWTLIHTVETTAANGTFAMSSVTKGGYFAVHYTGMEGAVYLALAEWEHDAWISVNIATSTEEQENGSYISTFSYDDVITALNVYNTSHSTDLKLTDVDAVHVGSGNSEGTTTVTKISWFGNPETVGNPFVDVTENNRFYDSILWAYNNGITTGKTEDTFAPEEGVTRAQFVTFLWRAAGEPEPASQENPFTDVGPNNRFLKAILWAYHAGITAGKTDTTFCPDDICTREQIVMFLYRHAGSPELTQAEEHFEDVGEGNRFRKAIIWANTEGITAGKTENTFDPTGICNRAQVVMFLYRYLEE